MSRASLRKLIRAHRTKLISILIISSLIATLVSWYWGAASVISLLSSLAWAGVGIVVSETLFIVGALLMAVSAGARLSPYYRMNQWWSGLRFLRHHSRSFARQLIVSPLFTFGFWCNFVGAVGTSVILIAGLLIVAPYTGIGIIIVIVIDLFATFGWRVPLEIARRKAQQS